MSRKSKFIWNITPEKDPASRNLTIAPSPESPRHCYLWFMGLFGVVFLLAAITIWPVLRSSDQVLAFNDGNIESMLAPGKGFPSYLLRIWDNQCFFGSGSAGYPLTFAALGECIGAEFYRRSGQVWITAFCAIGLFWAFRQYRISRFPAALAAAIIVFAGWPFNSAITGLAVRMLALACSAVALGFVERGRCSGQWLPYAIGGGFLGLAVAEVPDIGLLFALSTVVVFFWTHLWVAIPISGETSHFSAPDSSFSKKYALSSLWPVALKFFIYVSLSVLLAWQTISVTFSTQVQGVTQGSSESPGERYNWATQWSIPPSELWNAVSGSYFGSSMNSSGKPYWGRNGRTPGWEETHQGMRNFALTGWHIGVIPCTMMLALLALAIRSRLERKTPQHLQSPKEQRRPAASPEDWRSHLPSSSFLWLILIGACIAMMLMWGRHFFLYKLFWSLPYASTFRCADKWMGPFLLFIGIGIAVLMDALARNLAETSSRSATLWRTLAGTFAGMAILALIIAIGTFGRHDAFVLDRINEGYQSNAELMWSNAVSASMKVFAIALTCAIGAWFVGHRKSIGRATSPFIVLGVIGVIALTDLGINNSPYVSGRNYKEFLQPNPLTDYLDSHSSGSLIKLMPPNHPVLNNLRMTLLQVKGYDLFDPISVSRMPTDYAALFGAFENDPIRLWELGSIRYFLTLPGATSQLNKLDGEKGRFVERRAFGIGVYNNTYLPTVSSDPKQHFLRLVEFTGASPKYRFASTASVLPSNSTGDAEALRLLTAKDRSYTNHVILQAAYQLDSLQDQAGSSSMATIRVNEPLPHRADVEVTAPSRGMLVRNIKYDPFWKATVNGQATPIIRANYLFQAVPISAGTSTIAFSYAPPLTAMFVGLSSRIFLILVVILYWAKQARFKETDNVT